MKWISNRFSKFVFLLLFFTLTFVISADGNKRTDERFFEEQRKHLESSDPEEIREAIEKLTYVNSSRGVRDIISALRGDPNFPSSTQNSPVVKFYAAKALGKKGEPIATGALISEFKLRSESIATYVKPKRTLQKADTGKESVSSPYFFLENDISIVLACGEMLRALGSLPLTEESEKLIKQALTHKNFYIRASAADSIFNTQKVRLVASRSDLLGKETDPYTKVSFVSAIAGLERLPNQNFKMLVSDLENDSPEIRKKASEGLARMDLKLGATYLEKAISIENEPSVHRQMAEDFRFLNRFRVP